MQKICANLRNLWTKNNLPLPEIGELHDRTVGGVASRVPKLCQERYGHELYRDDLSDLIAGDALGAFIRDLHEKSLD